MVRTIIWFIYFWISLLFTVPSLIKAEKLECEGKMKEFNNIVYKVTSSWARNLVKLSGTHVKVIGLENIPADIPVLFVGNHQGNFDIPVYMAYINRPFGFIAKIEIKKYPIISKWMKCMKCIFMDRQNIRQEVRAINEGIRYLKQGQSLVIFPEGTRSRGDKMGDFKAGSFKLAVKSCVPVIPVTIKGTYNIMEKRKFIISPAYVEIIISKPVYTDNLSHEEIQMLPDKVMNIIKNNL
jgi:1-acyl-sn-glycerol-3-phosphate acyltransferase